MTKRVAPAGTDQGPIRGSPLKWRITTGGAATSMSQHKHRRCQLIAPLDHPYPLWPRTKGIVNLLDVHFCCDATLPRRESLFARERYDKPAQVDLFTQALAGNLMESPHCAIDSAPGQAR